MQNKGLKILAKFWLNETCEGVLSANLEDKFDLFCIKNKIYI